MAAVYAAKTVRTFCYGFLGIVLPLHFSDLGMSPGGVGVSVTLMLAGSAILTWLVRRPAERLGGRVTLLCLAGLTGVSALLLVVARDPWMAVAAAMLGNVAVGVGETGPFLVIEQVVVTRAVSGSRRTTALAIYNLLGYAAAAFGAATASVVPSARPLFLIFLAGSGLQAICYALLRGGLTVERPRGGTHLPSAPLIRRLAGLFALDAFAGGFIVQSLVAFWLHQRFGMDLVQLGRVFFVTQILTAASLLLAVRAAKTFGLLNTMVFSHLASNLFLIGIGFAPSAAVAVALLFARHLLSQMDVPTRQAYVMAIVEDHEREAAATTTTLARTIAQAISPALTGGVMQSFAVSAPFVLGGGLKIVYDIAIWRMFRRVQVRPEGGGDEAATPPNPRTA